MSVSVIAVGQRFLALSTDNKPVVGVSAGAILLETDTLQEFIFNGAEWINKNEKSKTISLLNKIVPAGDAFRESVFCEGFDLVTVIALSDGGIVVDIGVTKPDGTDYSEPFLTSNGWESTRGVVQTKISGLKFIKVLAQNYSEADVTADFYVYLGKT